MLVQMDVRSVLSASFRQMWKFLAVFVPIVIIGLIYVLSTTPQYVSGATLLVKFGQDARPEMAMDSRGSSLTAEEKRGLVQSNLNILMSRDIAEALIDKLEISRLYPEIAEEEDASDTAKKDAAVATYFNNLTTTTESNAGIIRVNVFHPEPQIAHEMLTTLIELFVDKQADIFGNPQITVLREQAQQADLDLRNAARALYDFKQETGIASIDEELTLLLQQRGDMVGYLSRRPSEGGKSATDVKPETTVSALPARISKSGDSSRFPVVEDAQRRIDELRAREAELLLTYKPDSDMVRNIRRNIAMETSAMNKSLGALNEQIDSLDAQIAEKQGFRSQYDDLVRDLDLKQESAKTAQNRYQVAQVNDDLNQRKITRISVIEQPTVPIKPAKPKKTLTMLLCLLIGGAMGAALCLGTEILDTTFARAEQLTATFKRPVLATFGHTTFRHKDLSDVPEWWNRTVSPRTGLKPMTVKPRAERPHRGFPQKNIAALYQSLESALPDQQTRVVAFTSSSIGEGTTTVTHELALMAAEKLGQNVLVVCTSDFMPAGGTLLPRPTSSLADVMQGRGTVKDAVRGDKLANGGSIAYAHFTNDTQAGYDFLLGGTEKLEQIFSELKQSFPLILIAAPGLIPNPSVKNVTRAADGVILVVEAEKTRAPVVQEALNMLSDSGGNILGMVFNKQVLYIPRWIYTRL